MFILLGKWFAFLRYQGSQRTSYFFGGFKRLFWSQGYPQQLGFVKMIVLLYCNYHSKWPVLHNDLGEDFVLQLSKHWKGYKSKTTKPLHSTVRRFNGYDRSIRRPLSVQGLLAQHLGVLAQVMVLVGRWIWWKLGAIQQWANEFFFWK